MSGTVNISRDIWDDTAFKPEPLTEREAWVWMVMDASYKPRTKEVNGAWVDLERGQLSCSVRFMCKAWKWSKSKVDRFLKRLENRDMIGTDSGTGINVITICKYDEYQSKSKDSGTAKSEKRDSGGTAVGQRWDKPNKDERKVKEGCKTSLSVKQIETEFDAFWFLCPRKVAKGKARTAYAKAIKKVDPHIIADGMARHADAVDGKQPKFIPHPATWLNDERWADEIEQKEKPHGSKLDGTAAEAARRAGERWAARDMDRRQGSDAIVTLLPARNAGGGSGGGTGRLD